MDEESEHVERAKRRITEHDNKATELEKRLSHIMVVVMGYHQAIISGSLTLKQRGGMLGLLRRDIGELSQVGSDMLTEVEKAHILITYLETYEHLMEGEEST